MEPRLFSHGYPTPLMMSCSHLTLQWSHGFSAMDTLVVGQHLHVGRVKLQWSHGFSAMDTLSVSAATACDTQCFNGATAFQPWIPRMRH